MSPVQSVTYVPVRSVRVLPFGYGTLQESTLIAPSPLRKGQAIRSLAPATFLSSDQKGLRSLP